MKFKLFPWHNTVRFDEEYFTLLEILGFRFRKTKHRQLVEIDWKNNSVHVEIEDIEQLFEFAEEYGDLILCQDGTITLCCCNISGNDIKSARQPGVCKIQTWDSLLDTDDNRVSLLTKLGFKYEKTKRKWFTTIGLDTYFYEIEGFIYRLISKDPVELKISNLSELMKLVYEYGDLILYRNGAFLAACDKLPHISVPIEPHNFTKISDEKMKDLDRRNKEIADKNKEIAKKHKKK